ncbi:MAG: dihydrolipoyl dehydrogenase [Sulfolobales archaeon]
MISIEKYDVVVIGGGPGGYPAAIRSAQLGLRVAIVENRGRFGGECTLYGCIPTKALVRFSDAYWKILGSEFVSGKENLSLNFAELMKKVSEIVSKVSSGIEYLLKSYGVDIFFGRAELAEDKIVHVDRDKVLKASKIIIATGTDPLIPEEFKLNREYILDNREIFNLRKAPSSIIIVGGGYVGVEFATILAKLGVDIHIVEMMPNLLPGVDLDASKFVEKRLSSLGVKIYKNTVVKEIKRVNGEIEARLSNNQVIRGEKILVAVGRKPNTEGLGLERLGVEISEKKYIRTNKYMQTTNPDVYASGDVAGPPLLAHKAFIQAVVSAENASGGSVEYDKRFIPSIVFTDPEIAQVGYSIDEAKKEGYEPVSQRLFLGGVARAVIEDAETGFIKIVMDRSTRKILGGVIVSPYASELVSILSIAVELGLSIDDLGEAVYPHPTMSEMFKEIIDFLNGKSFHYFIKKRS